VLIYTPDITPRILYIADFVGREITGKSFTVTSDRSVYANANGPKINYSNGSIAQTEIRIAPHSLLFQTGIHPQEINCFHWEGEKAFFKTDGDYPFDIFAATFFLISRYEEYLPHRKDSYGRFAHENSLAFLEDFLNRPLVNLWIKAFREKIREIFPGIKLREPSFEFLPTYDIDIAWSYKEKSGLKLLGGAMRSLLSGRWHNLQERWSVMRGRQQDPYDCYEWLHELHKQLQLKPYYFFLVAGKQGKFDKNISPLRPAFVSLVRDHFKRYLIGIHPSWISGDEPQLLHTELGRLKKITGHEVIASRQHYIRFTLGDTYRKLIHAGILSDFSMGYGSINGFRASVASPFLWYDLEREQTTDLSVFPFCYMDANSFYEQKYTPNQAIEEMRYYHDIIKNAGGLLITIWHNQFLGTDPIFAGWKEVYETFVKEVRGV
jgi:hypothetical protein